MLYVGVDAHKSTSQITVMNEAGRSSAENVFTQHMGRLQTSRR
jgi:hypothetical protein